MLTFGKQDPQLSRLIKEADPNAVKAQPGSAYLKQLEKDIAAVRDTWDVHKRKKQRERTRINLSKPQNYYKQSDLVFKKIRKQQKMSQNSEHHNERMYMINYATTHNTRTLRHRHGTVTI